MDNLKHIEIGTMGIGHSTIGLIHHESHMDIVKKHRDIQIIEDLNNLHVKNIPIINEPEPFLITNHARHNLLYNDDPILRKDKPYYNNRAGIRKKKNGKRKNKAKNGR